MGDGVGEPGGSALRQSLREQLDQLSLERNALVSQVESIDTKIGELSAAVDAIDRLARNPQRAGRGGRMTIKRMALEVLNTNPVGVSAKELRSLIWSCFGVDVSRESLAPQLSRLGQEGRVLLRGRTWVLTQGGKDALRDIARGVVADA